MHNCRSWVSTTHPAYPRAQQALSVPPVSLRGCHKVPTLHPPAITSRYSEAPTLGCRQGQHPGHAAQTAKTIETRCFQAVPGCASIASQCYPAAKTASALHTAGAQHLAPSQAIVASSADARTHTVIHKGHAAATLHTTGSIYVPRQGSCRYTAGLLTWRHACCRGPGRLLSESNLQLSSTHPAVQLNTECAYVQSVPRTSTTEPNPAHKPQCHTQRYTTSRYKPTHDHTPLPSHPAPLAPPSTCHAQPPPALPCTHSPLSCLTAALS